MSNVEESQLPEISKIKLNFKPAGIKTTPINQTTVMDVDQIIKMAKRNEKYWDDELKRIEHYSRTIALEEKAKVPGAEQIFHILPAMTEPQYSYVEVQRLITLAIMKMKYGFDTDLVPPNFKLLSQEEFESIINS